MTVIPHLYNSSLPSLEITVQENVCRKVSFPCTLVPVFIQPSPRTVDIRHSYQLVDPITQQKRPVGCTQKGGFPSGYVDFYYMPGEVPFIVQTDDLGCKEITCNKVSLYDLNKNRVVEVARILEQEDKALCGAEGLCPELRVIPSPSGNTLAVVVWDNNLRKQARVSLSKGEPVEWSTFTGRHTVHFVDTKQLLADGKVVKTTQRIETPPGSIIDIEKMIWNEQGNLFGWKANGNSITTALFYVDQSKPPQFGSCQGDALFLC
jgi:hypothetical protein